MARKKDKQSQKDKKALKAQPGQAAPKAADVAEAPARKAQAK